jgi:tetratricopeptide (TPR) repeat protein
MTATRQTEILQELFTAALAAPPSDFRPPSSNLPSPHPVDDEDLLLDWSLGDLGPDRHRQLVDHLAACPACRQEIAAMVRFGILELHVAAEHVAASFQDADSLARNSLAPDTPAHPASEMPVHVPNRHWRHRAVAVLVTALAASLLMMFARGVFDLGPRDGAALIAMAQRDLHQGRADQAFILIEDLLSRSDALTAEHQRDATDLLEASGYELARGGLKQGDFGRVTDIDSRVARQSGGSGRLTNLRIQAERGETAERSLAGRMSLREHYDYELDGQQLIKSMTIRPTTDTDRRIEAELKRAIENYPDEVDLRLNYGQLLLEQRHFQRAEAQFAAAVALDPQNALAHTGLGLAILEQADDEDDRETAARALPHFEVAVRLSPDDPIIQQNLTICQNRLSFNAQP